MTDFAAIDFETANGRRSSVCSVGIVIVRGGEVVDKFYSLIKPGPNYYMWLCQEMHGLDRRDTNSAIPKLIQTYPESVDVVCGVYNDTSIEIDAVNINVIASGKECRYGTIRQHMARCLLR